MAMKSDIQAAKDAGADHYLPKPFSAKELRQAIELYVNGDAEH
jgi:CheY-like chemotaxis protein